MDIIYDELRPAPEDRVTFDGEWTYKYDDAGNVVRKTSAHVIWDYRYDHLNRILEAGCTNIGPAVDQKCFLYGPEGDLLDQYSSE